MTQTSTASMPAQVPNQIQGIGLDPASGAYLIVPLRPGSEIEDMQKFIGSDSIDAIDFNIEGKIVTVWVDDEARLRPVKGFFQAGTNATYYGGRAVITGASQKGFEPCPLAVDTLKQHFTTYGARIQLDPEPKGGDEALTPCIVLTSQK